MTYADPHAPLAAADLRAMDALCDQFEQACQQAQPSQARVPPLGPLLEQAAPAWRAALLVELAALALDYHRERSPDSDAWTALLSAEPALAAELTALRDRIETAAAGGSAAASGATAGRMQPPVGLHVRCPHCCHPVELVADTPEADVTCAECGSTFCLIARDDASTAAAQVQQVGRFELLARLGVGGFGSVWKARDPELDRYVAVKIPRRGQLRSEEVELFFREARAAAQLRHPHIVPVYEIGRADDVVYIVSDLVEGQTLASWMRAQRRTAAESAEMLATIATALDYAHQRGIVHRDLKPSNVMVDREGAPQVMDFGLAKRESGEATMTLDGQILGTAAYMSPEQAAGHAHWTDRRADVYALGVILFEMLTGELPFRGAMSAQISSKLHDDPPSPRTLNPHVPVDLATICLKCLERDPNARYPTAEDVAAELRRSLAGEPIRARPIGRVQRAWRWAKRRPAAASALGLALVLAVAGPLTAITIDAQRRDLSAKTEELYDLVENDQVAKQALGREIASLQSRLDAVQGRDGTSSSPAASWRQGLIDEGLAAHPRAALGGALDSDDAIERELAWGMLLAEAGRFAEATDRLAAAHQALGDRAAASDAPHRYRQALTDCNRLLVEAYRAAGNEQAALEAAQAALSLHAQWAEAEPASAVRAVERLQSHYAALPADGSPQQIAAALAQTPALSRAVLDAWPANPRDLYALACALTGRVPWLAWPDAAPDR